MLQTINCLHKQSNIKKCLPANAKNDDHQNEHFNGPSSTGSMGVNLTSSENTNLNTFPNVHANLVVTDG